ncbi:hypothetical protein K4H01_26345, partial [Mycobacterium tuberculosis]|nr:hypothetical protein [Mycobacterium tuberculosis]
NNVPATVARYQPATNGQARQQAPQINSNTAIRQACRLYRMKTRGLNAFKVQWLNINIIAPRITVGGLTLNKKREG